MGRKINNWQGGCSGEGYFGPWPILLKKMWWKKSKWQEGAESSWNLPLRSQGQWRRTLEGRCPQAGCDGMGPPRTVLALRHRKAEIPWDMLSCAAGLRSAFTGGTCLGKKRLKIYKGCNSAAGGQEEGGLPESNILSGLLIAIIPIKEGLHFSLEQLLSATVEPRDHARTHLGSS